MSNPIAEKATTVAAGGAVVSPAWLPDVQGALSGASEVAALLLPIAGLIWLTVQIFRALKTWPKEKS